MDHDISVSERVIGCAIEAHEELGPGLLERPYVTTLCIELAHHGITFERERKVPLSYRGRTIGDYQPDLDVEDTLVIEVKGVLRFEEVCTAQMMTDLRLTNLRVGLIINLDKRLLRHGIKRVVL